jgi:hypothetical protein
VLFNALVVRLDPKIDVIKAYRRFARYHTQRVEQRGVRRLVRQASRGVDDRLYLRLERLSGTAEGLLSRFRQLLVIPRANFSELMTKWSFAAYTLIVIAAQLFTLTAAGGLAFATLEYVETTHVPTAGSAIGQVVALRSYQWIALAVVLLNGRKVLFRMQDKES